MYVKVAKSGWAEAKNLPQTHERAFNQEQSICQRISKISVTDKSANHLRKGFGNFENETDLPCKVCGDPIEL
jgi:hypothetical protein